MPSPDQFQFPEDYFQKLFGKSVLDSINKTPVTPMPMPLYSIHNAAVDMPATKDAEQAILAATQRLQKLGENVAISLKDVAGAAHHASMSASSLSKSSISMSQMVSPNIRIQDEVVYPNAVVLPNVRNDLQQLLGDCLRNISEELCKQLIEWVIEKQTQELNTHAQTKTFRDRLAAFNPTPEVNALLGGEAVDKQEG